MTTNTRNITFMSGGTPRSRSTCGLLAVAVCGLLVSMTAPAARALDNWTIRITVDNQYGIYFGTATATTGAIVGTDTNWPDTETWNAFGKLPTDYTYVATASDHAVAQGFLAEFNNTTQGYTFLTGAPEWEVFPAGKYAATNPFFPAPWPASVMPTQAQVDTAIAYATANNLWVAPTTASGYTNGAPPWGVRPLIPLNAQWIWFESGLVPGGTYPSPFKGGNHNEFLVFRVQPVYATVCGNDIREGSEQCDGTDDSACDIPGSCTSNCLCGTVVPTPTVSEWGLGTLALLLLSGVALKFGRRRAA